VGNAVGYALSGKRAAARFNTPEHRIFDHHVIALMGDGCMQEGVAREAIAFAGHNGLDNLILIYDSNDVTLDAMAAVTQSEDAEAYFKSQRWDVVTVDGHDLAVLAVAIEKAKADNNGRPKAIIAKTVIGKGIPEVAGSAKGHGEGGAKFADAARAGLGLPADEKFYVSPEVADYFAGHCAKLQQEFAAWQQVYDAWTKANPALAAELTQSLSRAVPTDLLSRIPEFPADYNDATRSAGGTVINAIAKAMPDLLTGAADLFGSTKNHIKDGGEFAADNPLGRNIWFGVREHAMGAICNGIAYDGLFRPSCATFLVFADYLRGSIRLAALAGLPVTYIFTHDSVGVGEDGPTHQPVEQLAALRAIPDLAVIRPADANETVAAWQAALRHREGPVALVLTRQAVPTLTSPESARQLGRGAYVVEDFGPAPALLLMASGSELGLVLQAARRLATPSVGVRVVSFPSWELFETQDQAYRDAVLPPGIRLRLAVEAGVPQGWERYVGDGGAIVSLEHFGASAPGPELFRQFGFSVEAIVERAQALLAR
jgi:transketolase